MSLSSLISRNRYTGNGTSSVFAYGFRIFAATDLIVKVRLVSSGVETTLALGTDYTVSGVGNTSGNVTLVNASQAWLSAGNLATGYVLLIRRVRPLIQGTSIRNQGPYYAATHEDVFDSLVMMLQTLDDDRARSVRLPDTFATSDFDPTIPAGVIGVPGSLLVTDSNTGTTFAAGVTLSQISSSVASAAASAASAAAASAAAAAAQTAATTAQTAAAASAASASSSATASSAAQTAAAASAASASASAASAAASAAPTVVGSRASPSLVTTVIPFSSTTPVTIMFLAGNGGAVALSANPQIQAGSTAGQRLMLIGCDSTNTVTMTEGTGIHTRGQGDLILFAETAVEFLWTGVSWTQL